MKNLSKSNPFASVTRSLAELQTLADKGAMPPCEGPRNPHWLGRALRWCEQNGLTCGEACRLVESKLTRPAQSGEVERMAGKVYSTGVETLQRAPYWPPRDDDKLLALWAKHGKTVAHVVAASPVPMSQRKDHPLDVLSWLHPQDALLYLSPDKKRTGKIMTLAEWRSGPDDSATWSMCVPNAMSKRLGINQEGTTSVRCRDTSGGFERMRYAVAETDFGPEVPLVQAGLNPRDLSATVILNIIPREKIVMIVNSAGKSLHAWLNVTGYTKSQREGFFQAGRVYGIDPLGRLPEHQFRLPNGTRLVQSAAGGTLALQRVLYFNSEAL